MTKVTALVTYSMSVEIEIDENLLSSDEGIESVKNKIKDQADSQLTDGINSQIVESSHEILID
jgi:hypothetical protein